MNDVGLQISPVERARAISGVLRDEAPAGERRGRLTDAAAQAILAANLCSIMVPREAGGLAGSRTKRRLSNRSDRRAASCRIVPAMATRNPSLNVAAVVPANADRLAEPSNGEIR